MRRYFLLIGSLCLWLVGAGDARAGLVYEFGHGGASPVTAFMLSEGGTLDVEVYLRETGGGNLLAGEGLFSATVRVTFDSPGGVAAVVLPGDVMANPAFDSVLTGTTATDATLDAAAFVNPFLTPDGDNRIYLGTFRFTGLTPGSVTIRVTDLDPLLDGTVTGLGSVLDPDIGPGQADITVVAVPEPYALVVMATCLFGVVFLAQTRTPPRGVERPRRPA